MQFTGNVKTDLTNFEIIYVKQMLLLTAFDYICIQYERLFQRNKKESMVQSNSGNSNYAVSLVAIIKKRTDLKACP